MAKWGKKTPRGAAGDEILPAAPSASDAEGAEVSPAPTAARDGAREAARDAALDAAVDTAVGLLREYGRNAFDLDDRDAATVRNEMEMWASHLLIGTRHPDDLAGLAPYPLENRDWGGARRFFTGQRQEEQRYVTKSINALRGIVWTFVRGFNEALVDERSADARIDEHLHRLERTLQAGTVEELRAAATSVLGSLTEIVDRRREQQRQRLNSLQNRMEELGEQLQMARQESMLDPLTRLYNRRAFDELLGRVVQMNRVMHQPSALLLIDVDYFKTLNDTYGHAAGDSALRALADCLHRSFPSRRDLVARHGGDEFAVILRDTPSRDAWQLAERLLRNVREITVVHEERSMQLTVTCGVAALAPGATTETWMAAADAALYRAKERGRDTVEAAN